MKVYISNYSTERWYHKLLGIEAGKIQYVKVDDYDVWSADLTLALIIAPTLRKLRDLPNGVKPFVHIPDRPGHLIGSVPVNGELDEFHEQAWDWALTEMIYAFESCQSDFSGEEQNYDDYLQNQVRIANGYRLFGKYYQNLWH